MKKNIVITILAILVLGLVCFIIYDKAINKEEKKENSVVEKTENNIETDRDVTFNDKLVANKLLSIMSVGACGGGYNYHINVGDVINYDDLPEDVKFSIAYGIKSGFSYPDTISTLSILESYNYIFGEKNHKLPDKANSTNHFVTYELTKEEYTTGSYRDIYKLVASGGGCTIGSKNEYSMGDITVTSKGISFEVLHYSYPVKPQENGDLIEEQNLVAKYIFSFITDSDHYIFDTIKRIQ